MIEIKDKSKCCGCHACFNICPTNAIKMIEDEYGFKYPKVNKDKCINCGLCEKKCPILNKNHNKTTPKTFACYNKDENIRMQSSSGGIFTLLAEEILNSNGVVFGASFDNENIVHHVYVEKKEDLYKLRTSKYLQSTIGETYKQAKEFLDSGRQVLYTGTPCQVNGFMTYLGKEYDNLYTQDIICHGVPSPKAWKKYLEYRKDMDAQEPINISFRKKTHGWRKYSVFFEYEKNSYENFSTEDLFMKAFLRDACLRESCYKCSFKDKKRKTDITLADFWGIERVLPEMDDDKGTSLLIVNTDKGMKLKKLIENKMIWKETDFKESITPNVSMYTSVDKPKLRKKFWKKLETTNFEELVKKYTVKRKLTLKKRIIRKCKKIIDRLFNVKD